MFFLPPHHGASRAADSKFEVNTFSLLQTNSDYYKLTNFGDLILILLMTIRKKTLKTALVMPMSEYNFSNLDPSATSPSSCPVAESGNLFNFSTL